MHQIVREVGGRDRLLSAPPRRLRVDYSSRDDDAQCWRAVTSHPDRHRSPKRGPERLSNTDVRTQNSPDLMERTPARCIDPLPGCLGRISCRFCVAVHSAHRRCKVVTSRFLENQLGCDLKAAERTLPTRWSHSRWNSNVVRQDATSIHHGAEIPFGPMIATE